MIRTWPEKEREKIENYKLSDWENIYEKKNYEQMRQPISHLFFSYTSIKYCCCSIVQPTLIANKQTKNKIQEIHNEEAYNRIK